MSDGSSNKTPVCCGEVIGVERPWYDGVAYWECVNCGKCFPRDRGNPLFDKLWLRRLEEMINDEAV